MDEQRSICKSCGSDSFTSGIMDNYAKLRPFDKSFYAGSALIYTFCKDCGEVSSIKVDKTFKFWVVI